MCQNCYELDLSVIVCSHTRIFSHAYIITRILSLGYFCFGDWIRTHMTVFSDSKNWHIEAMHFKSLRGVHLPAPLALLLYITCIHHCHTLSKIHESLQDIKTLDRIRNGFTVLEDRLLSPVYPRRFSNRRFNFFHDFIANSTYIFPSGSYVPVLQVFYAISSSGDGVTRETWFSRTYLCFKWAWLSVTE